jgi:hypothetical protein
MILTEIALKYVNILSIKKCTKAVIFAISLEIVLVLTVWKMSTCIMHLTIKYFFFMKLGLHKSLPSPYLNEILLGNISYTLS